MQIEHPNYSAKMTNSKFSEYIPTSNFAHHPKSQHQEALKGQPVQFTPALATENRRSLAFNKDLRNTSNTMSDDYTCARFQYPNTNE